MAGFNIDIGGAVNKLKDFINSLIGPKVYVSEAGKPMQEFTPQQYAEYEKQRKQDNPSPTPTTEASKPTNIQAPSVGDNTNSDLFSGLKAPKPPDTFANLIEKAASKYKVDPNLLAAIFYQESKYNPNAIGQSDPNDIGFAQINLPSHPNVTRQQALDPNFSIDYGARKLSQDIQNFGGDVSRGVAAYNVGRGGANVQGPETFGGGPKGQTYVDNVARNLTADMIKNLGLKVSPSLLKEYGL